MIRLQRTEGHHPDFIALVRELDAVLAELDGEEHDFYHQFNAISDIRYAVVAYVNDQPVACGAIKPFAPGTMEVKRMYTCPEQRGQGMASAILRELEAWAGSMGMHSLVLETGIRQPDAIALYNKHGYQRIPNYEPYRDVPNSICFSKTILPGT